MSTARQVAEGIANEIEAQMVLTAGEKVIIKMLVESALLAEREECAKVAEERKHEIGDVIAARIRSLTSRAGEAG